MYLPRVLNVNLRKIDGLFYLQLRHKSWNKDHWHTKEKKNSATDKALEHFDDFYKSVFRLKWPSVRLGLLTKQKYVALVNNFGDVEKTETLLSNLGAINIKTMFEVWEKNMKSEKTKVKRQEDLDKIFELDRVMEQKAAQSEEEDLNVLYPDGSGEKLKGLLFSGKTQDTNKDTTETIMESEEGGYEGDRVIDPDLGIDSGALQEFVPTSKLKGMDDFIPEADYYSYYKTTTNVPVGNEVQYKLNFPSLLKVFSFDRGNLDDYPQPRRCSTGVSNYFLMDGASILPVLALDVQPGDVVLDMCAAPGGKSLAILQTLAPKLLVCNDYSQSRVQRIHRLLSQYLYDYNKDWKGMLRVQQQDGSAIEERGVFNKILVDVPCTNDRHSLLENDNNIFRQDRMKERLQIPETQSNLLVHALSLVKPGGTVVYSTCSLSPVQNDGVVGMALRKMWEMYSEQFTVIDLNPSLQNTKHLFNYGYKIGLKYGSLVVPFLPSNFGPMYFCKIVKKTVE